MPLSSQDDTGNLQAIRRAAFSLMMEKGFSRTSYTDIAEASGCTRALVQYYFPKKDRIIVEFIERVLELSEEYIVRRGMKTDSCFEDFYLTGYIHFYVLLNNESLLPLTRDIVSSRERSAITISEMERWQHRYPEFEGIDSARITDAILFSIGGAYELINHHLANGLPIDIPLLLDRAISTYAANLGMESLLKRQGQDAPPLDDAAIEEANAFLLQNILA